MVNTALNKDQRDSRWFRENKTKNKIYTLFSTVKLICCHSHDYRTQRLFLYGNSLHQILMVAGTTFDMEQLFCNSHGHAFQSERH
jgi:hypothetical protein